MTTLTTPSPVAQTLTGLRITDEQPPTSCVGCGNSLYDGAPVRVRAQQLADDPDWQIQRVYCPDCHGETIETPTLGATGVLAAATLALTQSAAEQASYHCLADVRVLHHSPPTEGGGR